MTYRKYVARITKELAEYRDAIDKLEQDYKAEQARHEKEIDEMRGKYTEQNIEEYKQNLKIITPYTPKMSALRAKTAPIVSHYLELIEKQLNNYFNAPVRTEFATRINSIAITGLALSNTEFKILQESATSYMERRLLNQLAESRKKEERRAALNRETRETEWVQEKVADPYIYVEVPSIEHIYDAFNDYKRNVEFLLNGYSGKKAELAECLESGMPSYMSITADNYFRNNHANIFLEVMDKANSILPESKTKKELTEQDRKLIDVLIDPKYPTLAKDTVKQISLNSPELAELFSLDERYADFVPTDGEE